MIISALPPSNIQPTSFQIPKSIDNAHEEEFSTKDEKLGYNTAQTLKNRNVEDPIKTNKTSSEQNTVISIPIDSKEDTTETSSVEQHQTPEPTKTIYSAPYIKHNTSVLVSQLKNLIDEWNKKGTHNSISEISQVKLLLEDYAEYLDQTPEYRVLLGGLETIFDNDKWISLNSDKLAIISEQLEQFKAGNVRWDSLKRFSREIWMAEIA